VSATRSADLRKEIEELQSSRIVEVFNAGMHVKDLLPFWFGEGDQPAPDFVKRAAIEAIQADKVFYVDDRGIRDLRSTIATYLAGLHGKTMTPERIQVTPSGMAAVMIALQAVAGPGDNVVYIAPVWPNIVEATRIVGASPRPVALDFGPRGWTLDLDKLFAALDARTRAIFISSPGNPTGWMIDDAALRAILAECRKRRIWLMIDEVYNRITYDVPRALSPLDHADADDPVMSINSFSKSWAMTGFRLGWIVAPAWATPTLQKLNQFNATGAASFVQWSGIAAIEQGEPFVQFLRDRFRRGRDIMVQGLSRFPRVQIDPPAGAFYAIFRVDGVTDSMAFAKRLATEARVGVAPGSAFGGEGEGFIRFCFASSEQRLSQALERMAPLLR
jgi:aspartate/methionine/tyrosine aminotransferase